MRIRHGSKSFDEIKGAAVDKERNTKQRIM